MNYDKVFNGFWPAPSLPSTMPLGIIITGGGGKGYRFGLCIWGYG